MSSAIVCTLFEGHYHYGVAGLVNSLCKQGFSGRICVGYKGALPPWARMAQHVAYGKWKDASLMQIGTTIQVYFLPIQTLNHLTNYKPDFLLDISDHCFSDADQLFYFDPDIIVAKPWDWFVYWASCGIALCEDVNSPVSRNHPRRILWRTFYKQYGIELTFKQEAYFNGGFIGLNKSDIPFLHLWKLMQEHMGIAIGGLDLSIFNTEHAKTLQTGPFAAFGNSDQDALNACVEAWPNDVSFIGREAMGFKPGELIVAHALGTPKPWNKHFLKGVTNGQKPCTADKLFWNHMQHPVAPFSFFERKKKYFAIKIAALVGRFYSRAI